MKTLNKLNNRTLIILCVSILSLFFYILVINSSTSFEEWTSSFKGVPTDCSLLDAPEDYLYGEDWEYVNEYDNRNYDNRRAGLVRGPSTDDCKPIKAL